MANENANSINSLMSEKRTFAPPAELAAKAHISSEAQYQAMWDRSVHDSDAFWLEMADTLHWDRKPKQALRYTWDTRNRTIKHTWFAGRPAERLRQLP
jgi:hypothetical protein